MALSGSVKTGNYEGRYYLLEWTATQSESGNYSTVSWTLSCAGGSAGWYAERTLEVKIAGSKVYSKTDRVERRKGTIKSGTKVINHDDDGNASFDVSVRVAVYVDTVNCTGSKTFTLNQIARRSTLTVSDGTLGTSMTIPVTRRQETHVHTVTATCGSADVVTLCENSTVSSLTFTPPIEWARQNTTGTSVTVVYQITTYDGDELRGTNTYTTVCSIPSSVKPSCSVSYSDTEGLLEKSGSLVKGRSKLSITITPTTSYGSPIASYAVSVDGDSYNTQNVTTGAIKSSGSVTIDVKVTDKRGRVGSWSKTISILEYKAPVISELNVHRCDSDGNENDEGDYIKATFSASVVDFEGLNNTAAYTIKYKPTSDDEYTSKSLNLIRNNFEVEGYNYVFEADGLYAWDVQLVVKDAYSETTRSTKASTAYTLIHYASSGKGIAFGGMCEEDDFWCKMPAHFKKDVNFEGDIYINGNRFDGTGSGTGGGSTGGGSSEGGEGGTTTIIQQQYPDAADYNFIKGGFTAYELLHYPANGILSISSSTITIDAPSSTHFAGYFDFSTKSKFNGSRSTIVSLPKEENQVRIDGIGVKMPDGNIYAFGMESDLLSREVALSWSAYADGSYSVALKLDYSGLFEFVRFSYFPDKGIIPYVRTHKKGYGNYPRAIDYGYVNGGFSGYLVTYDNTEGKAVVATSVSTVSPSSSHFAGYFDFSDTSQYNGIKHLTCKLQLGTQATRCDGLGVKLPDGKIYYAYVSNDFYSDEVDLVWANYSNTGYSVLMRIKSSSAWEFFSIGYKSGNDPEIQATARPVLSSATIKEWIASSEGTGGTGGSSSGSGSKVTVTPALTSGTKIADISVDGSNKVLYAPEQVREIKSAEEIGYTTLTQVTGRSLTFRKNFVTGNNTGYWTSSDSSFSTSQVCGCFDFSSMPYYRESCVYKIPNVGNNKYYYLMFKAPDGITRYIYRSLMVPYVMIFTAEGTKNIDGSSHSWYQWDIVFWARDYNGGRFHDGITFFWDKTSSTLTITKEGINASDVMSATKAIYEKIATIDGGSKVTVTNRNTSGTRIATINIDGTANDIYAPSRGSGGGSTVSVTPALTSGTKIADITVDGTNKVLYAPSGSGGGGDTVTVTSKTTSGTNIADITINGSTTKLYAPTASGGGGGDTVTITDRRTTGTKIATINISGVAYDIYAPANTGGLQAMEDISWKESS